MLELRDGSLLAYLAHPDMRIPISYALNEGVRTKLSFGKVKLATLRKLTFSATGRGPVPGAETGL